MLHQSYYNTIPQSPFPCHQNPKRCILLGALLFSHHLIPLLLLTPPDGLFLFEAAFSLLINLGKTGAIACIKAEGRASFPRSFLLFRSLRPHRLFGVIRIATDPSTRMILHDLPCLEPYFVRNIYRSIKHISQCCGVITHLIVIVTESIYRPFWARIKKLKSGMHTNKR